MDSHLIFAILLTPREHLNIFSCLFVIAIVSKPYTITCLHFTNVLCPPLLSVIHSALRFSINMMLADHLSVVPAAFSCNKDVITKRHKRASFVINMLHISK